MGSGRRPQIATRAPVRASSRAVARPMPVPPPVTIATFPSLASAVSGERNPSAMLRSMPEVTSAVVVGDGGVRLSVRLHDAPTPAAPGLLLHHGLASSQRIWDGVLPGSHDGSAS